MTWLRGRDVERFANLEMAVHVGPAEDPDEPAAVEDGQLLKVGADLDLVSSCR